MNRNIAAKKPCWSILGGRLCSIGEELSSQWGCQFDNPKNTAVDNFSPTKNASVQA